MAELHSGMVTLTKTNGGQFEDGGCRSKVVEIGFNMDCGLQGTGESSNMQEGIKNNEGFGESFAFVFVLLK